MAVYAARWLAGEPRAGPEAKNGRWIAEKDIATLPTTPGLPNILAQAFALDRNMGSP